MTKIQRKIRFILLFMALLAGVMWLFGYSVFEPVIVIILVVAGLLNEWWPRPGKKYARKRLKGCISFDYSNNNGRCSIGSAALLFETAWSKASDTSIHIYNDPPSIDGLAVIKNKPDISDIRGRWCF